MSRTLKLLLVLCLFFIIAINFNFVQATSDSDNSNLEENTSNELLDQESENIIQENSTDKNSLSSLSPTSQSSITGVSPVNSYSQANLELNNILCIILIAIGVLIILFAIAILIRLKK